MNFHTYSGQPEIHPTALIDPAAELAEGVTIGLGSTIGPGVQIDTGTIIRAYVVIKTNTRIGKNNDIYQFSSIGEDPSDKKFQGEETFLHIGDNNIFREGVALHRGTGSGGGLTNIGSDNLLMPYVHVGHDCSIGNNNVLANNVGLTGHVEISDWVIVGGYAGVNQFLKIGAHAMIGGMTHITNDVPAYMIVSGTPPRTRSINAIGLQRRGFSASKIKHIREAYKIIYKRNLTTQEALKELENLRNECDALDVLIRSILRSTKGIHR